MKEVWGVLEVIILSYCDSRSRLTLGDLQVVREQCWLNEILSACSWSTEGLKLDGDDSQGDEEATEEELEAMLSGNAYLRSRTQY